MSLICPLSERELKYKYRSHIKDPYKYYNLNSFPESWKFGCLWGDFMSEDTTGSLTDASTTVMLSLMTTVPSNYQAVILNNSWNWRPMLPFGVDTLMLLLH